MNVAATLELEISNLVLILCLVCELYSNHVIVLVELEISSLVLIFYLVCKLYPGQVAVLIMSSRKFFCHAYNLYIVISLTDRSTTPTSIVFRKSSQFTAAINVNRMPPDSVAICSDVIFETIPPIVDNNEV